jgi:hypothetical protein
MMKNTSYTKYSHTLTLLGPVIQRKNQLLSCQNKIKSPLIDLLVFDAELVIAMENMKGYLLEVHLDSELWDCVWAFELVL